MSRYRCLSVVNIKRLCAENVLVAPKFRNAGEIPRSSVPSVTDQFGAFNFSGNVSVRLYGRKTESTTTSSSSDSEGDKYGARKGKTGESNFWRQKMRTHHMVLDVNKDGVVSWDDFEVLIKNVTTLGRLSKKDLSRFTEALQHVWQEEWGASGDPYAFISAEQFLSNMERVVNTEDLRKKIAKALPYFFNAVDYDGSGVITIDEFKTFYKCLHLSEEAAEATFSAIDQNNDGKLSKKEFVRLGRDFFLSEDENSSSTLFWGPLAL